MTEIGLGEHGAAGSDLRRLSTVLPGQFAKLGASGKSQPAGLLIEEAARSGGAGGTCFKILEPALGIKAEEHELLSPDYEQRAHSPMIVSSRFDKTHLRVVDMGLMQDPRS
jgi:hypothetical protein